MDKIHGFLNASTYFSEVVVYSRHIARGLTIVLGLLYSLVIPISIFGIYATHDLSVLVPSNSSTIQVAYDPNAPTKKQVDDACKQAVNFYFGTVVSTYSKELLQPLATDNKGKQLESSPGASLATDNKEKLLGSSPGATNKEGK
ncbi:10205_t:CDS:2 [Funneliformis geosporum]|uniref:10205_t:CDS:1 n=1 Tax=Funneliformis geosporum TaxID=1117311 RepID=A0A9W4SKF4_9GLOM|nr:10205_t:CDS:2 [Funneliformis geosporum]